MNVVPLRQPQLSTRQLKAQLKKAGLAAHAEGHSKHAVGIPAYVWIDVSEPGRPPGPPLRTVHLGFRLARMDYDTVIVGVLAPDGAFAVQSVEEM